MTEPRQSLLAFGDSICEGLGVGSLRYSALAANALGLKLEDFSHTGWTCRQSLEAFRANPVNGEVAVIAHGVTEPILRPDPSTLRFLPRRWRRVGWMDPRPYYSRRLPKRALEHLESMVRWRIKNLALRISDYQFMDRDTYVQSMAELIENVSKHVDVVLIVEPSAIDERYFPGSRRAQAAYWRALAASGTDARTVAVDLEEWDDFFADHFHPNASGHSKIARSLIEAVRSERLAADRPDH
ncbi:GDSL-type esterase/lipase family protein [Demequina sp. NBRC 110052]|uniref:GDSL-type esterase/lipase family protein n=1 Tax=Demequina sp. NBRC 110052 TaxID=1570341 RepID=UPI0009FC6F3F|nr:GDSL-type esterase/lipase family protein [Demequina sp. NBRC 110052]